MSGRVSIYADSRYPVDRTLLRETVWKLLSDRGVGGESLVEISIVGDRKMRDLNRKFRSLDQTTDVLSFPLEQAESPDGVLRLGDVVVSWPQARGRAIRENRLISQVVADLVEHGLLHLLGIHHND